MPRLLILSICTILIYGCTEESDITIEADETEPEVVDVSSKEDIDTVNVPFEFTTQGAQNSNYPDYESLVPIELRIDSVERHLLNSYRKLAFIKGLIPKDSKKYVKAYLKYDSAIVPCSIRLKGEWLDHLEGDKWSFRIKTKERVFQNKKFSIHTPFARNYLKEYLAHKVFEDENLLCTKYDFYPVRLNGKSLGMYAYEEYFEKNFGRQLSRKQGVVVRWDEEGFWQAVKMDRNGYKNSTSHPKFKASFVSTFSKEKVLADTSRASMFNRASQLLYDFRDDKISLEEAFCVDQLAKYYALLDLFGSYHGSTWHNIRYFYNSDSLKLEPILFDGYTDGSDGVYEWFSRDFVGRLSKGNSSRYQVYQLNKLFNSDAFKAAYLKYAKKYSTSNFIELIDTKYNEVLKNYEALMQEEFDDYKYDYNFLSKRARSFRAMLAQEQGEIRKYSVPIRKNYFNSNCTYPVVPLLSFQIFTHDDNGLNKKIKIINNYCKPVEIYANKKWTTVNAGNNSSKDLVVSSNEMNFQLRLVGSSKIYSIEVFPYSR